MKYDAIVGSGIEIGERVPIPADLVPPRRAGRDRSQEGGRLLHARPGAERRRAQGGGRPQARRVLTILGLADKLGTERNAALSLLSAAAVRERAHEMLAAGLAGTLANFRVDLDRLAPTADFVAERDPRELSRPERAAARALAAFRVRRTRSVGGDRREGAVARCRRARARRIRSRHRLGAARCRRRTGLALSRRRDRPDRRPLGRPGARQPAHVRGGAVLRRRATIRCAPTRSGWRR